MAPISARKTRILTNRKRFWQLHERMNRGNDLPGVWKQVCGEISGSGYADVGSCNSADPEMGSFEHFVKLRHNLGAKPARKIGFVRDDDPAASRSHRIPQSARVQRRKPAKIQDACSDPSRSKSSAASSATRTMVPQVTMATSLPLFLRLALPTG